MDSRTRTLEAPAKANKPRVGPCLILLWRCDRPLEPSVELPLSGLGSLRVGRGPATATSAGHVPGELRLALGDESVSSSHFNLVHVPPGWVVEDAGSKNGTFVNGRRVPFVELHDGDLIECGQCFFRFRAEHETAMGSSLASGAPLNHAAANGSPPGLSSESGLATITPDLRRRAAALPAIARSSLSVLILGESGTGKELVAREVHRISGRTGPLLPINCAALSRSLYDSELFGFRKNTFTGATEARPGLYRTATSGTLFLDEIGDLPFEAQGALLRALQEGEVRPVGGTEAVKVDTRIIAATHRDLPALVAAERFRDDLYARLSQFIFELPPLRDRADDIPTLTAAILRRLSASGQISFLPEQVSFTPAAARSLLQARWKFNIRELEQKLRVALTSAGPCLDTADLPVEVPPAAPRPLQPAADLNTDDRALADRLIESLRRERGNVAAVAREMGKARMQIHRWLTRFGIDPEQYRR